MAIKAPPHYFTIDCNCRAIVDYHHVSICLNDTDTVVATFPFNKLEFESETTSPQNQVTLRNLANDVTGSFFLTCPKEFEQFRKYADEFGFCYVDGK